MVKFDRQRAYALIDAVMAKAKFDTVVTLNHEDMGLTRFANSEIHQNMASSDTGINIMVFDGEKMASTSTNVLDEGAVLAALNAAEVQLPLLQPSGMHFDHLNGLEEIYDEARDFDFDTLWGIEERADVLTKHIEDMIAVDSALTAAGAFEVKHSAYAWGNSKGVKRFTAGSVAHLEVMMMHTSGASGYSDVIVKRAKDLDVSASFAFALEKAKAGLNPILVEPGQYDVVLEPLAVNDLVSYIAYLGANSKFHQDGMSPFVGQKGQVVAQEGFTMIDDGLSDAMIGMPFDFEGYPRQVLPIIENGVFKNIAYDTHTAKKDGVETTGHSVGYSGQGGYPFNSVISPGSESLESLIASTERGLLVSRFHYMNVVDPRTGCLTALTRDGLFLIEGGKVTAPVKNLRFTDTLPRILKSIEGITANRLMAPSFFGSNLVPGIKVKDFHFTGSTNLDTEA